MSNSNNIEMRGGYPNQRRRGYNEHQDSEDEDNSRAQLHPADSSDDPSGIGGNRIRDPEIITEAHYVRNSSSRPHDLAKGRLNTEDDQIRRATSNRPPQK